MKITKEEIVRVTCEEFGIDPGMLKLRSRREPIPIARAFIAHLLYRELGMFPRDILPLTGHLQHNRTVIYHYLGRTTLVERLAPYNKELRQNLQNIRLKLAAVDIIPVANLADGLPYSR